MALTDTSIRNAKPRERVFKLYDEKGLYLEITPKGENRWRFRYRRPGTGKENRLSLGLYPEVSLKAARSKRDQDRALLAEGIDPSDARQMEKQATRRAAEGTFQAVAEAWRDHHLATKSEGHQERTWGIVRRTLLPYIGKRPISEITPPRTVAGPAYHRGPGGESRRHTAPCRRPARYSAMRLLEGRQRPTPPLPCVAPSSRPAPGTCPPPLLVRAMGLRGSVHE